MALLILILEQWPNPALKSLTNASVGRRERDQTHLKMMTMMKTMRPPRDKLDEEQPKMSGIRSVELMRAGWLGQRGTPHSLPEALTVSCRDSSALQIPVG